MTTEIDRTYSDIKRQLNIILLNSTFADRVEPHEKISNMITFPEDIDIIRKNIKRIFKYDVTQDIADMTPYELVQQIHQHDQNFRMPHSEKVFTQKTQNHSITAKTSYTQWSRREIFGHVIVKISKAMGRSIQATEKISDLIAEAAMSGFDLQKLNYTLKELENFFGIKIDQSMKVYNAANAAEVSFIAQGRAPAHDDPKTQKDPLWDALMTATSMKYLKSVLHHNLNIRVSTHILSNIKSYEEFKALIQSKQNQIQK